MQHKRADGRVKPGHDGEGGGQKLPGLPISFPPFATSLRAPLHMTDKSPEHMRPEQKTAMKLTPVDSPPARPDAHPICLLIPSADEDELQNLTDDIRAHGLLDPIVLFEGMILDGRNRAAACERAGVAPRYVRFAGDREDA